MIKTVKRRRKQRYHRLREMIQSSSDDARHHGGRGEGGGAGIVCPVCLETVFGDPDVTEAHVDACLVHATPAAHEEAVIDVEGPSRIRATDGTNLAGLTHPRVSTIAPALNSVKPFLQPQVSTLGMQPAKMLKMRLMLMGTTRGFSVRCSSRKSTFCLRRGP